jgi:hypothetical protein
MMENHSFDNRVGMLRRPGVDGFRLCHGLPTATNPYASGQVQHAFRMPTTCQLNGHPAQDWLASHVVPIADFFTDAAAGTLPATAWSSPTTEHSPKRTRRI